MIHSAAKRPEQLEDTFTPESPKVGAGGTATGVGFVHV
jgi:hypothetical protein